MYSTSELQQIKNNIVSELLQAKNGQPSSFPFIKHNLSHKSHIKANETFQVLVIGGSYFRNSLLKLRALNVGESFRTLRRGAEIRRSPDSDKIGIVDEGGLKIIDGKISIIKNNTGPLPVFNREDQFLQFIEQQLENTIQNIALNFGYPLTPILRHNILDGILQIGSKEHRFDGMIDKTVGRLIEEHIKYKWDKTIHVAVTNDAMCLLLSGLTSHSWDTLAAGIVGTGLNFAIFLDKHTAVNLEAANFKKFPPSEEGMEIDSHSASPGSALYEKETAGAYLYQHFNIYIQKHQINHPALHTTEELDSLSHADIPKISQLAQFFLNRSASLVGAQIAGILEFCKRDLTFIMQGSLYWNANQFSQTVKETVLQLTSTYKAHYINIKDSDLYGAAELLIQD